MSGGVELDLDFFEVRFVVRTSVESDDLHQPVCRRIAWEKQGGEAANKRKIEFTAEAQSKIACSPRCPPRLRDELCFESLLPPWKWPINGASELSVVKFSDGENFHE